MTVVCEARNLALSAQLVIADTGEPFVEDTRGHLDEFEGIEEDCMRAFGIVIGVFLTQCIIQVGGKFLYILRTSFPLHEPLVTATLALGGKHRRSGIVGDRRIVEFTNPCHGALGILLHQLLAKGVDETLGASRYLDLDR